MIATNLRVSFCNSSPPFVHHWLLMLLVFIYLHLLLSSIYILEFPFYHMLKHVQEVVFFFFFFFFAAVKKKIYIYSTSYWFSNLAYFELVGNKNPSAL